MGGVNPPAADTGANIFQNNHVTGALRVSDSVGGSQPVGR